MTCRKCQHTEFKKSGFNHNQTQRYKCRNCCKTFSDERPAIGNHYTDVADIERILLMLLEGMSVRAIERITGIQKRTVINLMLTASHNAVRVFDALVRNVRPKFVQLDELWAMVGCHGKNVTVDSPADWGDAWTWLALDSEQDDSLLPHRA
jgi:transposase-like protein